MRNERLQILIEVAIFASLAMVLDFLPSIRIGASISISFAMVPIFMIAFRRGFFPAVLAGFLWGMLQIALGNAWILVWSQAFIEYFIAFACVGFAGLFVKPIQTSIAQKQHKKLVTWMILAVFVGGFARYFWHFVAGVIFFKKYAYDAGQSPFIYSLLMNGITYIATSVLCAVVMGVILTKAGRIMTTANKQAVEKRAS